MALPLQLRIKTTSERLRTNHIDLLEYTEKLSQENEMLKKNMEKVLRSSSLPITSNPTLDSDEPEEDNDKKILQDDLRMAREEVEALTRQLLSSETEKKTLKARAQMNKPDLDERLINLRARLEEETRAKKECSDLLIASQEEIKCLAEENSALRVGLETVRRQAYEENNIIKEQLLSKESETTDLSTKLQEILGEMNGMSEYHTQCMEKMMKTSVMEMEKQLAAEREIQRQQKIVIETLYDELTAARAASSQASTKPVLGTKGGLLTSEPDSLCDAIENISELCCECKRSLQAVPLRSDVDDFASGAVEERNINFAEYVKQIEEIRMLKIQLAAASNNSSTSSSSASNPARQSLSTRSQSTGRKNSFTALPSVPSSNNNVKR